MKVLLIRPEPVGYFSLINLVEHEPLELEYLATVVAGKGHDAVISDRRHEQFTIKALLKKQQPHVVCLTGYITQENLMKRYVKRIKEISPQAIIILGGSHVELNYKNFYDSKADYLYHISGLEPFGQLLEAIHQKENDLSAIPGICYRQGDQWIENEKVICHTKDLIIPDRSFFDQNPQRYRYLSFRPLGLVKNAFSCPYSCNFCYCTNMNGGVYSSRSAESLVDEIQSIDSPNIHIVDDDFLVNKTFLREFIRLIQERSIQKQYLIYGRADFIAENPEIMADLKGIGVALVMVGLETISNDQLDSYNKKTTVDHNAACVAVLRSLDIICAGLFMVHPNMERGDFDAMFRWIVEHQVATATISIFTPMMGTKEFEENKGELLSLSPEKQDLAHCIVKPAYMSLPRFYFEYYRLSVKLFFHTRKHPLYENIGIGAVGYVCKAWLNNLWKIFVF